MGLLINLVVFLVVIAILWYIVSVLPLPPPMVVVARVIFALIALILFLSMIGAIPGVRWNLYHP